jgi:hypothetical protein
MIGPMRSNALSVSHLFCYNIDKNKVGLSGLEREEFLFKETLGKDLVPTKHLNDVVAKIQSKRHTEAMATLLSKVC